VTPRGHNLKTHLVRPGTRFVARCGRRVSSVTLVETGATCAMCNAVAAGRNGKRDDAKALKQGD